MNHLGYDRLELLLQMARHYGLSRWTEKLAKLDILSTERKCWMLIYDCLKDEDEFNAMLEREIETDYLSTGELAIASLRYPYLESESACMKELWILYLHYQAMNKANQDTISDDTRKRDQHISKLLLRKEWTSADVNIARVLINRAVLSHLFLPVITYRQSSRCQSGDSLPF